LKKILAIHWQGKRHRNSLADFGVRKYDEDIGGFTSIDPLWEKYYSLTPYHYCGNNPVSNYDKNGKNYIYQITQAEDGSYSISITIPIYLSGDAHQSDVDYMTNTVDANWNNLGMGWYVNIDGVEYNLNFQAEVQIGSAPGSESDNTYEFDNTVDRSNVNDFKNAIGQSNTWSTTHEIGHFLGLGDRYTDVGGINLGLFIIGKQKSVADGGCENTMMSQYGSPVTSETIENFIQAITPIVRATKPLAPFSMEVQAKYHLDKED
jgi:RHS repeat-associated protein